MQFKLKTEYIELTSLLKIAGFAGTGGQAGIIISNGEVMVNGQTELRKRAKIKSGDVVQYMNKSIHIV